MKTVSEMCFVSETEKSETEKRINMGHESDKLIMAETSFVNNKMDLREQVKNPFKPRMKQRL